MRDRKTTLVLGAGASKSFGLPLGKELKETIADDLNIMFDSGSEQRSGSYEIVEALRTMVKNESGRSGDINPHRIAAVQISESMPLSLSIDEFIERHKDNTLMADCGKLAISKAILEAERNSSLSSDENQPGKIDFNLVADSWLASFMDGLTRGRGKGELEKIFENVYIINFNYDRCVEHFCFSWLMQMYSLSEAEASEVMSTIRIFHPYGKLGSLRYENANQAIPFGGKTSSRRLLQMSERLKTYSESIEEDAALMQMRYELEQSDKLVFLGFGFHQQNMDLMQLSETASRPSIRYYASTLGIRAPNWEIYRGRVMKTMNVSNPSGDFAFYYPGDCEGFWAEYQDVITQ